MTRHPQRPDQFGGVMALTLLLTVWLAHESGIFRCADEFLRDISQAHSADPVGPNTVLLVYADRQTLDSSDDRLVRLIQAIRSYDPSHIGIAHPLSDAQLGQLEASDLADGTVVGCSLAEMEQACDGQGTAPGLRRGFLDLQLQDQPIYRWHVVHHVAVDGRRSDSLEAALARRTLGGDARIPNGELGIRFQGGADALPHVDQHVLLDRTIVPELVSGRIVLIGKRKDESVGLVTPSTLGAERMSQLELHGNILETLVRQNATRRCSGLWPLVVLFILTAICSQLFRQISSRWLLRSGLALLLAVGAVCWVTLSAFAIQFPISAMWVTVILNFIGIVDSRFQTLQKFFDDWSLLRRANFKTTGSKSQDDIWSLVADSAHQTFDPTRLVILELIEGSAHLQVRAMVQCDDSEIRERRRDVHRAPYRDAVEQRSPQDIAHRPFLNDDHDDRTQMMVPLLSGSEVQGVMVMEFDQSQVSHWTVLEDDLSSFAAEMAAFIAGVRERQLDQRLTRRTSYRLQFLPEQLQSRLLYQEEVDQYIYEQLLVSEFDASETAVAVGDIFGSVAGGNQKMLDRLQSLNVEVAETDCLEILAVLTGMPDATCRDLYRRCLDDGRSEQLVLAPSDGCQTPSVLHVKQLKQMNTAPVGNHSVENRWVSIQLHDAEILRDVQRWQQAHDHHHCDLLCQQLSRLHETAKNLERQPGNAMSGSELGIACEVLAIVQHCHDAIQSTLSDRPEDCYRVDTAPLLQSVIESIKAESESRGVRISRQLPERDTEALCNPFLLRRVFKSILDTLLDDASRQDEIIIDAHSSEDRLCFRFRVAARQSSGGQQESFSDQWQLKDAVIEDPAAIALVHERSERFIEAARWLNRWDARLRIDCGTSYQLSVELELARENQSVALSTRLESASAVEAADV